MKFLCVSFYRLSVHISVCVPGYLPALIALAVVLRFCLRIVFRNLYNCLMFSLYAPHFFPSSIPNTLSKILLLMSEQLYFPCALLFRFVVWLGMGEHKPLDPVSLVSPSGPVETVCAGEQTQASTSKSCPFELSSP